MPSTNTDRLDGLSTSVAVKSPCKAVATTNITLSGEQTIGGVACVSGDRVLVIGQASSIDNGIWVVSAGSWSRAKDFDGTRDATQGTLVTVYRASGLSPMYRLTTSSPVIGTSALAFEEVMVSADILENQLATDDSTSLGAALVGYRGRTVHGRLDDIVNVMDYGAVGDGATDETDAVTAARVAGATLWFPPGRTYNLQNWVPPANTTILARGATINRHDDTEYSTTGSSAAVVITNSGIQIHGGTWDISSGATKALPWSGSVVIEDGSVEIFSAKFTGSWGGVFGHELQNGSKVADFVRVESCEFDACSHNTYFADINNLIFVKNHSHNSDRDGLRAYRNIQNLLIDGNYLYSNGNGSVGQSQDGMDLFFGGKRCIVTNNYIYDNDIKGIDIKRGSASAGETVFGEKFIIANNHIYDNGSFGIQLEQSFSPAEYNENTIIVNNQIYGNTNRGIFLDYCKRVSVLGNHIYENGNDGIRVDNSDSVIIQNNIVYDNTGVGILTQATVTNTLIQGNECFDSGAAVQTQGINAGHSGICKDNNCHGNTSGQIASTVTNGGLRGHIVRGRIASGTSGNQYIGSMDSHSVVTGAKLIAGSTSSVNFSIQKRSASDGTLEGTLYTNSAESVTADLGAQLTGGTWTAIECRLLPNEMVCAVITSASVAFTMGQIELSVIN